MWIHLNPRSDSNVCSPALLPNQWCHLSGYECGSNPRDVVDGSSNWLVGWLTGKRWICSHSEKRLQSICVLGKKWSGGSLMRVEFFDWIAKRFNDSIYMTLIYSIRRSLTTPTIHSYSHGKKFLWTDFQVSWKDMWIYLMFPIPLALRRLGWPELNGIFYRPAF